ncbi:MAG: DUF5054 domain-containing protein [Clostridia bacterium]|nr:DUF5054 domain-containing protein [Clostridia bacterium]
MKKIYVIFKTHLDIGFTDFSENIRKKYIESYIPKALETAKELRERGGKARFIWTTGSWIIHEYIKTLDEKGFEDFRSRVNAGDIRWHALPFTTHTELMDSELFCEGIGLSKELDSIFGMETVACKMTDVPGHTRAIVPYLAKAGVEFLHIGVNPASAVPKVPDIFRWVSPSGEAVTVMYNADYGTFSPIADSGVSIYFAHAGDNISPPSADDIEKLFETLQNEHPECEIIAATLEDVAMVLRTIKDKLPVVTGEIGDSWIHGAATDPGKVSMFRALLRFRETIADKTIRREFNRRLLLIPEHTWGLDVKKHLNDHCNFSKADFAAARNLPNYMKMEQSWKEQRAYLDSALSVIAPEDRKKASAVMESYRKASVTENLSEWTEMKKDTVFEMGDISFSFDKNGAINHLKKDSKIYADTTHRLAICKYTQLSPDDYKRFFGQYIRLFMDWVDEDNNKIGMENAVRERKDYSPELKAVYKCGNNVTAIIGFDREATEKYGCPERIETTVKPFENGIEIDLAWFEKPANRCAEMINLGFEAFGKELEIRKLGEWITPEVIDNGSKNLHATDYGVRFDSLEINSLDGALVSIGRPAILDFQNTAFDKSKVWFNLYNNQWGTNFPMWYDEDARFRYRIICK